MSLVSHGRVRRRAGGAAASWDDDEENLASTSTRSKKKRQEHHYHCNSNGSLEEAKVHMAGDSWAQWMDWILTCRCCSRRTKTKLSVVALIAFVVWLLVKIRWITRKPTRIKTINLQYRVSFRNMTTDARFSLPLTALLVSVDELDQGGLVIEHLHGSNKAFQREIQANDFDSAELHRQTILSEDPKQRIIPYRYWYGDDLESLHLPCRRPSWANYQFLNCNTFHETSLGRDYQQDISATSPVQNLQEYDIYLVNHGYYRDCWVNRRLADGTTTIFKTTRFQFDFSWRNLFDVQREALIMERLTAYSNIVTSFGHCGTSVLTEAVPHEVEGYVISGTGYRREKPVEPQNDLSAREKLSTALAMAESIAVLHGYEHGVIVHNDVQLQQWLRTSDGDLKLGDFNRATIPDWNVKEKRYCKYNTGASFGNVRIGCTGLHWSVCMTRFLTVCNLLSQYRAPEEFAAGDLDERIDVYSFSNNIYCLVCAATTGILSLSERFFHWLLLFSRAAHRALAVLRERR